ncbi:MAG: hypothetical protein IKU98_05390 [Bacteroidaceae bacterium]|nr:hypothetical protein [Bacteroidaceae bacterium]
MNAKEKALVKLVKRLVREVEPNDSPGVPTQWCLQWLLPMRIKCNSGVECVRRGVAEVSVDKECSNGNIYVKFDACGYTSTFRFVSKALRKAIVDMVKPMYGIYDTKKKVS